MLGHRRDLGDIKVAECRPEGVPLPEDDRPAQPDLEHAEGERLENRRLVIGPGTPYLVVVTAESGICCAGPGANTMDFRCLRFAEVLRLLCSVRVVESVSRMASSA
jgi:hypothetical protein